MKELTWSELVQHEGDATTTVCFMLFLLLLYFFSSSFSPTSIFSLSCWWLLFLFRFVVLLLLLLCRFVDVIEFGLKFWRWGLTEDKGFCFYKNSFSLQNLVAPFSLNFFLLAGPFFKTFFLPFIFYCEGCYIGYEMMDWMVVLEW